jgi:hypothetical protein
VTTGTRYTAIYYKFGARRETTFDSLGEALDFLTRGSMNDTIAPSEVLGDDGTVLKGAALHHELFTRLRNDGEQP